MECNKCSDSDIVELEKFYVCQSCGQTYPITSSSDKTYKSKVKSGYRVEFDHPKLKGTFKVINKVGYSYDLLDSNGNSSTFIVYDGVAPHYYQWWQNGNYIKLNKSDFKFIN